MNTITRFLLDIVLGDWKSWELWSSMSIAMPALTQIVQNVSAFYPIGKRPRRASLLRQISQHRPVQPPHDAASIGAERYMSEFAAEVRALFGAPLLADRMLQMSTRFQAEYRDRLFASPISMLPSFQHILPTGRETGSYLAIDVGGSTLRLALINLRGQHAQPRAELRCVTSFVIDERIRSLRGRHFFEWMAERIDEVLKGAGEVDESVLPVGMAWSFPVEQTSPQSGRLLAMGKGFHADQGLLGLDLGALVEAACQARGLRVEMRAIVNDGAATLLSQAYSDPSTRMSLILGTGMNAALYLPTTALGRSKLTAHPPEWHAAASRVVVNTELSMFGKKVLPITRWDEQLNTTHIRPNFQPLEYLVTGRYLGEIVRLVLVDGIRTAGLFGGYVPSGLSVPYAFDTKILAAFDSDSSPTLATAGAAFQKAHPLREPARVHELRFIQDLARLVSRRAAAYLAISLHALWAVRADAENQAGSPDEAATAVTVACDGSMIEKYPGFRAACQGYLDRLCVLSGAPERSIALEMTLESCIFGAAVAASCNAA